MYCTEFVFDGISSREYDLMICSFDGGQSGEMTAGSSIEFTTFRAPGSPRWRKTDASWREQLAFSFQICKNRHNEPGSIPFTERELAFLMRWLVRRDYKWLQFIQEGYENIFYHCQINVQRYMIAGQCYGLTLDVTCDAPFGWSQNLTATISSPASRTVHLYDSSDEPGEVYPCIDLFICTGPQNIQIENLLTDKKLIIRNCVAGEHIIMNDMIISSSECKAANDHDRQYTGSHTSILNDFNYQWFTIGNTFHNRDNEIKVTGNCEIILNWRVPRKAVV